MNRLHSQGAGLSKLNYAQGQQSVGASDKPLGTAQALLPTYNKLQEGNVNLHFFDKNGNHIDSQMLFGDTNFNPATDSLKDVADKFAGLQVTVKDADGNDKLINVFEPTIQDGKLILNLSADAAANGIEFAMGADSSGLMAALGINTFFAGTGAHDMAVNSQVHTNTNLIAAGQVNGDYEINVGDNATATAIGKLADKTVTISTLWKTVENQSISQYYANLVTTVGADRRSSKSNAEYHVALSDDLYERVTSVTGVNMDEEMTNLIKYQHSYTAAAKLITTADEMLQTLLSLKQ